VCVSVCILDVCVYIVCMIITMEHTTTDIMCYVLTWFVSICVCVCVGSDRHPSSRKIGLLSLGCQSTERVCICSVCLLVLCCVVLCDCCVLIDFSA